MMRIVAAKKPAKSIPWVGRVPYEAWYLSRPPFNSGTVTLSSAGVGTRLAVWKDTSLQLEAGKPLDAPPGFKHGWTFEVGFKSVN